MNESTFFDQMMGQLQKMGLTGMRNFVGRTAATLPGRVLGGEGGRYSTAFRLDEEPLPFDRPLSKLSSGESSKASMEMALNFMSPGMIIGRKGAERLGGELWRKFLAGERAAGEGMAPQRLWREFGYAKGAEGKGRMEISDVPAELLEQGTTTVGQGVQHPELFAAYPELMKLPLEVRLGAAETRGGFNPGTGRIKVFAPDKPQAKSAMMHELQHVVQKAEEFAPGTNLKLGSEWYKKSAGEVEARNVQARLENPDLMRFSPEMTEEFSRAELLGKDIKWSDLIQQNPQAVMQAVKNFDKFKNKKLWQSHEYSRRSLEDYKRLDAESKTTVPVKMQDIRTGAEMIFTEPWEKEVAKQMILIMREGRPRAN